MVSDAVDGRLVYWGLLGLVVVERLAELTKQLDYPKGDPRNPLTDQEVEEKFDALAGPVLSKGARAKLKQAVWDLEKQKSISTLMALCTTDR